MSRKHILLVEDEMLISMDMESTLTELGHTVAVAISVNDALSLVEKGDVDLAILDFHLKTGDTTALALHLQRSGVPFVVCSGTAGFQELGAVFEDAPFLSKPFSTDGLVAAVDEAARSRNVH